jgi:hypothetical protein
LERRPKSDEDNSPLISSKGVIDRPDWAWHFRLSTKEKEADMLSKLSSSPFGKTERKDQIFNLPLPTVVEGRDAAGRQFQEKTVLYYISHKGASFNLTNLVVLGSKLKLFIDLPSAMAEDKNLKLVINGKVALVEANHSSSLKQRVSLRFENKYFIKEDG